MDKVVQAVGAETEKAFQYTSKHLAPVSIIPSLIVGVIVALLILVIGLYIVWESATMIINGVKRKLTLGEKMIGSVGVLIVSGLIGLIAGGVTYEIAFAYENPRLAAGMAAVDLITDNL